ncbi:DsrE family protein [Rhodoferax sp.]|uniref:DsrE family protein n=1 Tax=Rhodoferax sp. TaxID=50421 RepID=UPI0028509833|nr:DsrE family protein [Rhodoferax sp.]MDR3367821.1 DsrE family protein [Rhodoferax sp.]
MNRRTYALALALLGGTFLATGCANMAASANTATPSKLVIQVSDGDAAKWNLALNNARNAQHDLGADKVKIEIVAFGPGIDMLTADSSVADRVSEAVKSGVQVAACENTMAAKKLTKADMNPSIGYASSGVVEIMRREQEGWSYLRP